MGGGDYTSVTKKTRRWLDSCQLGNNKVKNVGSRLGRKMNVRICNGNKDIGVVNNEPMESSSPVVPEYVLL